MERFLIMTRITRELPTTFVSIRIEKMVLEMMSCSGIIQLKGKGLHGCEACQIIWSYLHWLFFSLGVQKFNYSKPGVSNDNQLAQTSSSIESLKILSPLPTCFVSVHAIGDVNYMNGKNLTKHQVLHFVENSSWTAAHRVRFSVPRDLF